MCAASATAATLRTATAAKIPNRLAGEDFRETTSLITLQIFQLNVTLGYSGTSHVCNGSYAMQPH